MKIEYLNKELLAAAKSPDWIFFLIMGVLAIGAILIWALSKWSTLGLWQRAQKLFPGKSLSKLSVVTRSFPAFEFPNLCKAIEYIGEQDGNTLSSEGIELNTNGLRALQSMTMKSATPNYVDIDVDYDKTEQFPTNQLFFLKTPEYNALFCLIFNQYGGGYAQLDVMSGTHEQSGELVNLIREKMNEKNVFRNKMISLDQSNQNDDWGDSYSFQRMKFHCVEKMTEQDVILPEETTQLIKHNSINFFQNAEKLKANGYSVKRGLLLHGKPGTGKSSTIKWLVNEVPDVSVILVTGSQLWSLQESCRLAKALAPSIVVMEDVDLVAEEREKNFQSTALNELLNEMDGVSDNAEVMFLLTTNRPEILEPALINRPGRVDLAIEFPLPDEACRRKLFKLYTQQVKWNVEDEDEVLDMTDGASPAFIKELVRKAALFSALKSPSENGQLHLNDNHFKEALREMSLGDGSLSREFMGFHG